jgi:hypothetical protein
MDIHIRNIPAECTNAELRNFLVPLLANLSITEYVCAKIKNKAWGMLYIDDHSLAESFIRTYHRNAPRWRSLRHPVRFEKDLKQTGGVKVRSLKADIGLSNFNSNSGTSPTD